MDVSDKSYGWIQTSGPCVVLYDPSAAITLGAPLTISDDTAGAVQLKDAETEAFLGIALDDAPDDINSHGLVILRLE